MNTDNEPKPFAFRLATMLDSNDLDGGAETWSAELTIEPDEDDVANAGEGREVLARATLYRAHLEDDWMDQMDAIGYGPHEVATELHEDSERLELVEPDLIIANGLVVVDYVHVEEHARGRKLSHELVRVIGRVFRTDLIALRPAELSTDAAGELIDDPVKRRALIKHWRAMGFVPLPNSPVLLLPLAKRG